MKRVFILFVLALLALSLAGCKDDGTKDTTSTGASSEGAGSGTGSSESNVETTSEGDDWSDKFTNLVSAKMGSEFTVSYDINSEVQGDKRSYKMTEYFGGKGRFRIDSEFAEGEGRMYFVDNKVTSCNKADGKWQCMQFATEGQSGAQDPTEQFRAVEDHPDDYSIGYAGTMSVAGTTAYCYTIDYAAYGMPGSNLKYCFSKEGIPLYMLVESQGMRSEMKATSFKKSVSDSDFTYPAQPQDMAALMAQYQQQMPNN